MIASHRPTSGSLSLCSSRTGGWIASQPSSRCLTGESLEQEATRGYQRVWRALEWNGQEGEREKEREKERQKKRKKDRKRERGRTDENGLTYGCDPKSLSNDSCVRVDTSLVRKLGAVHEMVRTSGADDRLQPQNGT